MSAAAGWAAVVPATVATSAHSLPATETRAEPKIISLVLAPLGSVCRLFRIRNKRHGFAVRALEGSISSSRKDVGRHMLALSTTLGHANLVHSFCHAELGMTEKDAAVLAAPVMLPQASNKCSIGAWMVADPHDSSFRPVTPQLTILVEEVQAICDGDIARLFGHGVPFQQAVYGSTGFFRAHVDPPALPTSVWWPVTRL